MYENSKVDTFRQLSAFSGQSLEDQAIVINQAIQYILDKYKHLENPPTSVTLLCHSMGGISARMATLQRNYRIGSIHTIYTLSSPHNHPPAPISRSMMRLYYAMDRKWKTMSASTNNITLVAVAGGRRDKTLNSALVPFHHSIINKNQSISVFATNMPFAWSTMDHEGALWCNQVLEVMMESMLAQLDSKSYRRVLPIEARMDVLKFLLKHRYPGKYIEFEHEGLSKLLSQYFFDDFKWLIEPLRQIEHKRVESVLVNDRISLHDHEMFKTSVGIEINNFEKPTTIQIICSTDNLQIDMSKSNRTSSLLPYMRYVPVLPHEKFQITFRSAYDARHSSQFAWTILNYTIPSGDGAEQDHVTVNSIVHDSSGFMQVQKIPSITASWAIKTTTWDLIMGKRVVVKTPYIMSSFVFPRLKDSMVKYKLKIDPRCGT